MNILYAIQGTGNGHITRAQEIIPYLKQHGNLTLLISGTSADVSLNHVITYKKHGLGYTFGKKGGIDWVDSIKKLRLFNLAKDVLSFPVHQYDLIINDFEPITAWACKLKAKPCFGVGHQAAFVSAKTPRPIKRSTSGELILSNYAPSGHPIGFHFKAYDDFIKTPIIRNDIRKIEPSNQGHITVYLPAFDDHLLSTLFQQITDIKWHVFSKHCHQMYHTKNVWVEPVNDFNFLKSMAASDGVICGAGFETPAEALYLRKKLLVVPMQNQYEQLCNAEALKLMGITVVKELNHQFVGRVKSWLNFAHPILVNYTNQTQRIVEELITTHQQHRLTQPHFQL